MTINDRPAIALGESDVTEMHRCAACGVEFEDTLPGWMRSLKTFRNCFDNGPHHCPPCAEIASAKRDEERKQQYALEAATRRQEQWKELCPPLYRETTEQLLPDIAKGHMEKLATWQFNPRGLLLMGKPGTGKTRLLWMLGERLFLEGRKVQIKTAAQFSHECTRAFSNGGEGVDWSDRMTECDVLMIDDLGKGRLTERTQTELFGIVDTRMAWKRPIFLTMNHDGASLAASLSEDIGGPLIRRLRECCEVLSFQ